MNIKEQENQLAVNLSLRIVINIVAFLALVAFMGYRLYVVSRLGTTPVVLGVAIPRLKVANFEALSEFSKSTESGVKVTPVFSNEPFD
ncbi:MAG: hypothetical protein AAB548_02155 [Patescibacteria group bacterium]